MIRMRSRLIILAVVLAVGAIAAARPREESHAAPVAKSAGSEAPVSTALAVGASCETDAQCASGLCYEFRERGKKCSQQCTTNSDCPSGGTCNHHGYCK